MSCRNRGGVFRDLFSAACRSSRLRPWWDLRGALIGGTRLRRMAIGGPGGPWVHAWTQNIQGCSNLGPRGQIRTDTSRKREKKMLKILPERKLCSWGPHRRGDRRRIVLGPELGKWGRRWRSSGASPPPPPHQSPPRGSHPPLLEAQHSEPDILGALPLPGNGSTGRRAPPDIGRSRNFPLELMLTMTSPCTGRNLGLGIISDLK